MAADLVNTDEFASAQAATIRKTGDEAPVPTLPAKRVLVRAFAQATALVRAGNSKPCLNPRPIGGLIGSPPELAAFKRLSRLLAAQSYVAYADGDLKAGTQVLLDLSTFADRIAPHSMIHCLVGLAMRAAPVADLARRLDALSLPEIAKVRSHADSILSKPTPLISALDAEKALAEADVNEVVGDMASLARVIPAGLEVPLSEIERWQAQVNRMTPQERAAFRQRIVDRMVRDYTETQRRLRGPESAWEPVEPERVVPTTLDQALSQVFAPFLSPACKTAAMRRTQTRLLRTHCAIIEFRWEHRRLPKDLKELGDSGLASDPLTGGEFRYVREEGDRYRLWSEGSPTTGIVEVVYRPASTDGDADPTIRP